MTSRIFFSAILFVLACGGLAQADRTHVAVAANFTDAANEIARAFAAETGHQAVLSFGATGQLFAQITQGAPFEVFLSADNVRPAMAVAEGYGVEGSVFTYATGQLVLYSPDAAVVTGPEVLKEGNFQQIALANPEAAPYGKAAVETMQSLGVYEALQPKMVQGQNIAQTFQFIETGNAELGFVALGQVARRDGGSRWVVPQELFTPIRQDAVLLKQGEDNPAATAFIEFLKGDTAAEIIEKYGYATAR